MKLAACHPNRKHKARGLCGACYMAWLHENNKASKAKYDEYQAKYHSEAHNIQKAKERLWDRAKRERMSGDPAYALVARCRLLRKKYGITLEDYAAMLASQNGGCAICSRKPGNTPLHVDHCHETGVVRGLLCHQCNWYLGTIEASLEVRQRFYAYVEKADEIKRTKTDRPQSVAAAAKGPDGVCASVGSCRSRCGHVRKLPPTRPI